LGFGPICGKGGVLTLPKRFKRDGLALVVLGDAVDPDVELCIEDLLEILLDD
jgi:hypothetical protein